MSSSELNVDLTSCVAFWRALPLVRSKKVTPQSNVAVVSAPASSSDLAVPWMT